jgi:hypothetical protein
VAGGDDPLQGRPSGRPEPLEAGELRLDGDARRSGGCDQTETVLGDRLGGGLPWIGGSARLSLEPGRIGIEAEADLASPLLDEGD